MVTYTVIDERRWKPTNPQTIFSLFFLRDLFKEATIKGMERLLKIWSERGVFELSYIEKLRKLTSK
jgi:hypothetical protein